MKRRDFVRMGGTGAALLSMSNLVRALPAANDRPNVLFLASDDLNDWIGCFGGYPGVKTPNIDKLASQSVKFTRAYCTAPLCNPSRTAAMTGLRPTTTGVFGNGEHPWYEKTILPAPLTIRTIPQSFKDAGYYVMGSGKLFHTINCSEYERTMFDEVVKKPWNAEAAERVVPLINRVTGEMYSANYDWGPLDIAKQDMGDAKLMQWAGTEITRDRNQPVFIGAGLQLPHFSWFCPREFFDMYPLESITLPVINENDWSDIPASAPAWKSFFTDVRAIEPANNKSWKSSVQAYLACISFVDYCIGEVMNALDASPARDNTIVVFWGDHGFHLGEKLTFTKDTLWEEACRVPLIIRAPGVQPAGGGVCERTVNLLDIYPTLLDLCDIPIHAELEGVSLKSLLVNPSLAWNRPSVTTCQGLNHSVRSERWRYTVYKDGSEELYDHDNDDLEWTNLAKDSRYAAIKAELKKWVPPNAPDWDPTDTYGGRNQNPQVFLSGGLPLRMEIRDRQLHISMPQKADYRIKILDSMGKVVFADNSYGCEWTVTLDGFHSGSYAVNFNIDGGEKTGIKRFLYLR